MPSESYEPEASSVALTSDIGEDGVMSMLAWGFAVTASAIVRWSELPASSVTRTPIA